MNENEESDLTSVHWALGSLILVGLASSELSGGATIISLGITAVAVVLGALCHPKPSKTEGLPRRRKCSDLVDFFEIWLSMLEYLSATATCARIASTTMDYMSRGTLRDWLFGIESHSLGEAWPDVLGVTIVVVTTALFMMGLEKSVALAIMLYIGLVGSLLFFVIVGSFHTDTKFWSWAEDFNLGNWKHILTAAAMCSYAFPTTLGKQERPKLCLKYVVFVLVPFVCYCALVLVFTLMSHFREISGTAIPLVRVFEVREVDWARPIMAVCTILVGCLAITEILPSLYNSVIHLAGSEWGIFVSMLAYRNPLTGSPILAIFTAGSLASILAFACPLSYLVRLLSVSPLLKCVLRVSKSFYNRHRPEFKKEPITAQQSGVNYTKLNKGKKRRSPTRRLKAAIDIVPRILRNTPAFTGNQAKTSRGGDDKECLLLDDYSRKAHCSLHSPQSESESETNLSPTTEMETETSDTDVDALVEEYKDNIEVTTATTDNFSEKKSPTLWTSRTILTTIVVLYIISTALTTGFLITLPYAVTICSLVGVCCVLITYSMPVNKDEEKFKGSLLFPVLSIAAIILNVVLANTLLFEVWFGVILWCCAGLLLFCHCECCNCEDLYPTYVQERQKLQGQRGECSSSNTFPTEYDDDMDVVLVSR